MDPVSTLKRAFKPPAVGGGGGSGWGSTTSTSVQAAAGPSGSSSGWSRGGTAVTGQGGGGGRGGGGGNSVSSSSFTLQHGSGFSAQPNMLANAVKRAKNNAGGVTYRDGESTGYEDDGSEVPDLVSIYKPSHRAVQLPPFVPPPPAAVNASSSTSRLTPLAVKSRNTEAIGSRTGATSQSTRAGAPGCSYFKVMVRKPQAKKHKTWDGDGVLMVEPNLRAILYDSDTAVIVARGLLTKPPDIMGDEVFKFGSRELQIDEFVPEADFLSGKCFNNHVSQATQAKTVPVAAASTSSFYGAPKALPGKAFTAPRPIDGRASAYGATKVGLPPPAASYKKKQKKDLSDLEGPDTRLLAGMSTFPSNRSFTSVGVSSFTAKTTAGLGPPPKPPKPLFDPEREGAIVMKRLPPALEKRLNSKGAPIVDVVVDPMLSGRLRDHQREGVQFLYESVMGMRSEGEGCILADEMGLGKTVQAISLIWTLLKQTPFFGQPPLIAQAVIVCPVTLVKNWKKEFYKWLGKDRIKVFSADSKHSVKNFVRGGRHWQVLIIGYERLRTVVDELKDCKLGLMICDEGHRLKSAGAKTTKALRELRTQKRVILSGTPIQNELSEFHSMVDFVNPGILDSYTSFKKIFEQPIMRSRQPGCPEREKELGLCRAETLNDATTPFILRRRSDIIANYLPPKTEFVVFVSPTPIQKQLYGHVLNSGAAKSLLYEGGGRSALVLVDLLRKICNSPSLLMRQEELAKSNGELVREMLKSLPPGARSAGTDLSGKMKALRSMLKTLRDETEEKIVVVSNFTQTLNLVQGLCERSGFGYCRLDGSTKAEDRQLLVDKFNKSSQDEQFVFMLSTKAGGTGLNIVGASRLVLFDCDWNPANDLQAMGRIHRDGQTRPCFIYRLITTGTIDEKIFQRQITKMGLADSLMQEGTSKGGKDGDAFSPEQLRSIFRLEQDTACETHDKLECACKSGAGAVVYEKADEDGKVVEVVTAIPNDADSDDELPDIMSGFVRASQYRAPTDSNVDMQKNLAVLKEWNHVNCQVDDDNRADYVEDNVLRDMILMSMESLRSRREDSRDGGSNDDEDSDSDAARGPPASQLLPTNKYQGGEVTFVFHKKKGAFDENEGDDSMDNTHPF